MVSDPFFHKTILLANAGFGLGMILKWICILTGIISVFLESSLMLSLGIYGWMIAICLVHICSGLLSVGDRECGCRDDGNRLL